MTTAKKTYLNKNDQILLGCVLRGNDYGWERIPSEKKVILSNPEALQHLDLRGYASIVGLMGHAEWEYIISAWMIDAVGAALETGEECDLTDIFNTELYALPARDGDPIPTFSIDELYKQLIKSFTVEEDTSNRLVLSV